MEKATITSTRTSKPAFLIIGPPGGGKTSLALGFPRLYIADLDMNLDGPLNIRRKTDPNFTYFYDRIPFIGDKPVPPEDQYQRLLSCMKVAAASPEVSTLCLDGVTHLDNIIKAKIVKDQGKDLNISSWVTYRKYVIGLITTMRQSGKTIVVLCHEENKEKEDPTNPIRTVLDRRVPLISSKLKDALSGLFTDAIRCEARPGVGGKSTYWVQVSKTNYDDLKNSFDLSGEVKIEHGEDAFTKMNRAFKLVP